MRRFIAGVLTGIMIAGCGTVMAKSGKMIEVFYNVKKLVVDSEDKALDKENIPFIYKGQPYVPLSLFEDCLDIQTGWNAKTGTIFIGEEADEEVYYWGSDLKDNFNKGSVKYYAKGKRIQDNEGNVYTNYLITSPDKASVISFPLKGKYKAFRAVLGTPKAYTDYDGVNFIIEVDGEEVYNEDILPEDASEEINIDLTDADKITFKTVLNENSGGIALFNGEFVK